MWSKHCSANVWSYGTKKAMMTWPVSCLNLIQCALIEISVGSISCNELNQYSIINSKCNFGAFSTEVGVHSASFEIPPCRTIYKMEWDRSLWKIRQWETTAWLCSKFHHCMHTGLKSSKDARRTNRWQQKCFTFHK